MTKRWMIGPIGVFVLVSAMGARAYASGPWDGRWFYDSSMSQVPSHAYALSKGANGSWKHDDGDSSFEFALDGKPHPESEAGLSITVRVLDATDFNYVEASSTGATAQHRQHLSADSMTITDKVSQVNAKGHKAEDERTAVRIGGGSGFEGRWKTMPKPYIPPAGPFWIISSSTDGMMAWTIPYTGELIQGKADGQSRSITGPGIPAGTTFVWKQPSADRIEFYASEDGRLVEIAIETLSADGKTFTDTLWPIGHEDEKRVSVYRKE